MRRTACFLLLFAPLAPVVVASCGGSTTSGGASPDAAGEGADASSGGHVDSGGTGSDSGGTGSDSGGSGGEGGGSCYVDPPGTTFTFHVHNAGSRDLGLAYGCGGSSPITLSTPSGPLSIGPGAVNPCEFTCEGDYKGPVQNGCSDCGGGVGADLAAGTTADIGWDHRVYVAHTADPQCVGGQTGVGCALAEALAPSTAQQGTLVVCTGGASSGGPGGGYCSGSESVSFTLDVTQSAGTIDVQ
jgi:hypothetical protein